AVADEWPQWRGPNRDGVWSERGVYEKFPAEQLARRWSVPIGSGYSGPTVAEGCVLVTDRVAEPKQIERIHCFDWKTGEKKWTHTYDCPYVDVGYTAGPRASVSISDGRAYALGAMGHLHCLDVDSGEVIWKHDCNVAYRIQMPIWGIAASPLIYEELCIVQIGGDGACVVAFDKQTGKEVWKSLDDRASYSAPIIIQQAGEDVLMVWTGEHLAGLEPATGKVHWKLPTPPAKMIINIATPVLNAKRDRVFLTSFYDGSRMIKLDQDKLAAEKVWEKAGRSERDTEALHSIIATPVFDGEYIYGVDAYGQLRCLKAENGERVWEDLTATPPNRWSNIHTVRNGDKYWMFNERGELIICKLSPEGFNEISRAKLIDPTTEQLRRRDGVCWSHPAYAHGHVFARSDKELVCASLLKE
ncbi:MAG: PQQ-binding-like beta-propeller repeat protein, partial [Pirellulales bacterium]